MEKTKIAIETFINAGIEDVWDKWILPAHITQWNAASEDWHTPKSYNDFKVGGKCINRMEAKDGSMGFDFECTYTDIELYKRIASVLADDRKVEVRFEKINNGVLVNQIFEAENENPIELQQMGWQAILNNFKKYVEDNH
jgi:uncharacterized protein YndB with AHSA1/START domain